MAKQMENRGAAVLDPDAEKTLAGTKGMNRTGIKTSADLALELIRGTQRLPASPAEGLEALAACRASYVGDEAPVGTLPRIDGAAPADEAKGALLLDKLGERLAFERRGVRLYESLIGKVRLLGADAQGPSAGDLEEILADERDHFALLQEAVVAAGGDPTVMTPSADIAATLTEGAVQVVADPRTTLTQCLHALLAAELADNDGWELLRDLADSLGDGELAGRLEEAREREEEHLKRVRTWLSERVIGAGGVRAAEPSRAAKAAGEDAETARRAAAQPPAEKAKAARKDAGKAGAKPKRPAAKPKRAAAPKAKSARPARAAGKAAAPKKPAARTAAKTAGKSAGKAPPRRTSGKSKPAGRAKSAARARSSSR